MVLTWMVQLADRSLVEHSGASLRVELGGDLLIEDANELPVIRYDVGGWRSAHIRNPVAAPVVVVR
jgi:hypothetical protein